ncbi:DUF262 domain-containing protein (plasmid) [Entomospira entomophila]|uniref:DUF262 domain-containing protein n=1 Tax=Entomospira entomophila TaxID=2719988 RepID=A0A968KS09_9SPIO|nr:DUF262 domain-containing protein [Entomospira entomophilus]NIZ41264.1 DUF262 domain-containing protein [Entomospira entomophilus]WDI36208.1 DUF262 domain-containing protein [Entomospira entomophilus]
MALVKEKLGIQKISHLLMLNLAIPDYQRPYRWSKKSINTLFQDTYKAFTEQIQEYRLGSIIFHQRQEANNHFVYDIVDGQQRLTSLAILLYCLAEEEISLLQKEYDQRSYEAIRNNFHTLQRRVAEIPSAVQREYKSYVLSHCTVVQIVTDDEQEAFQFFDSQNSRGRALAPHDLLKSHHLREMVEASQSQKITTIEPWENMNQDALIQLFQSYLYPLTRWIKRVDGLGYNIHKIDAFKGIQRNHIVDKMNYTMYHLASHLFMEDFANSKYIELMNSMDVNQFQLSQPVIAGRRFFLYTMHYHRLLETIQQEVLKRSKVNPIPNKGVGDLYIKQLYTCALLLFADRFGLKYLSEAVYNQLYTWCYSFRLAMQRMFAESINAYALGKHERLNKNLSLFSLINEMSDPREMTNLSLERPEIVQKMKDNYPDVYRTICAYNHGWS